MLKRTPLVDTLSRFYSIYLVNIKIKLKVNQFLHRFYWHHHGERLSDRRDRAWFWIQSILLDSPCWPRNDQFPLSRQNRLCIQLLQHSGACTHSLLELATNTASLCCSISIALLYRCWLPSLRFFYIKRNDRKISPIPPGRMPQETLSPDFSNS